MRRQVMMLTACVVAWSAPAFAGPTQDLDSARDFFRKKDCASAMRFLKDVLYPVRLASADAIFEARAMLGACFVETGDRAEAKAEFERALQLKPNEPLDPSFYSEPARRLFDDTKADIENRAKKDEELRKLQKEREALEAARKSLRVYRENPYWVNFMPFGFGQRQNGHTKKWLAFGSGQLVTLGTSVGIWFYLVNRYGIRSDKVPLDEGPTVRRLQQIEIGTGVAFFGLYAWSIIDGLRHHEPQRRVAGDDDLIDKALDESKPKPQTSLRERLQLTPMLMPNGWGIGIGGEL